MTSVKDSDKAQTQRAEQERLQKVADQQARETQTRGAEQQQFKQLLNKGQTAQKIARDQAGKQAGDAQGARLAEMARGLKAESVKNQRLYKEGGVQLTRAAEQAKVLNQELGTKRADADTTTKTQVNERQDAQAVQRERVEERGTELDRKAELKKEQTADGLRAERAEKGRANAAIDADARGSDDAPKDGDQGSVDAAKKAQKGADGAAPVAETRYTREPQKIPEEIMKKLVDAIYVGVNEKGLATFRMDLKDGAVAGASVEITADSGRVSMTLSGLDGNTKNLFEASKGDLMRRLERKGLILEDLSFR